MTKYRIVIITKNNGEIDYYPQLKGWFFWFGIYAHGTRVNAFTYPDPKFSSKVEAEKAIERNRQKDHRVKSRRVEYLDN